MNDSFGTLLGTLGAFFVIFVVVMVAVGIGIAVLYILTLRKALSLCAPQNRTTSPDSAWFLLIPLFNLIWPFILYPHISESLEREFRQRNLPIEPQPAKTLGLALSITQACCIVPVLNAIAGIGALVCFILYWIKISGYSNRLAAVPAEYISQPAQPQRTPQPPLAAAASASASGQQVGVPLLPKTRFCTTCGASVRLNERFCGGCGKPAATEAAL